jgi:hypothetical protein
MSLLSVRLRFDAHLKVFAAGTFHPTHQADLQIGEQIYDPKPGRAYYSGRISAYVREPVGLGPNPVQTETGAYQVSMHRAQNEADTALIIAAAVAEHFKRATVLPAIAGAPAQPAIQIVAASELPLVASAGWVSAPVVIRWFTTSGA